MAVALFWIGVSFAAAIYAKRLNRSNVTWFFISLIFSPLLAFILLLSMGENEDGIIKTNLTSNPIEVSDDLLKIFKDLSTLRKSDLLSEEELQDKKENFMMLLRLRKNKSNNPDNLLASFVDANVDNLFSKEEMIDIKKAVLGS